MIAAFFATDLCLLTLFRSFDFGLWSLTIAAPCCFDACLLVILSKFKSFTKCEVEHTDYGLGCQAAALFFKATKLSWNNSISEARLSKVVAIIASASSCFGALSF